MINVHKATLEGYVKHAIYLMITKMYHLHNQHNSNAGTAIKFHITF